MEAAGDGLVLEHRMTESSNRFLVNACHESAPPPPLAGRGLCSVVVGHGRAGGRADADATAARLIPRPGLARTGKHPNRARVHPGEQRSRIAARQVAALIPAGARCLVVEDSAHNYDTTLAASDGFARFVPAGEYFVVEDGCVDIKEMRLSNDWPRGVLRAIRVWLATPGGGKFTVRRDLERYGLICHPHGFPQRVETGDARRTVQTRSTRRRTPSPDG